MFLPLQAEGWNGVEDGESRCVLAKSSIQVPLIHNPLLPSPYAGPSSSSVPRPSSPPIESATAYQRRLKNPEHVPRPRNAFIIFRCEFTNNYVANGGSERASDTEKRSLSKRAGEAWGNATLETKRHYKELADQERARHRLSHPDYRFRPKRQKSAGQTGGRRSSKRGVSSPRPKRPASRSSPASPVECNKLSQNDPLQIKTITIPTSSSTLSQPYLSRHPTPDFSHGCGSTTPTSPCSPLSPVDDILYMPRPTIAADHPDSLLSYSTDDSQVSGYLISDVKRRSNDRISSMDIPKTLSHPYRTSFLCSAKYTLRLIKYRRTVTPHLLPLPPRWQDGTAMVRNERRTRTC